MGISHETQSTSQSASTEQSANDGRWIPVVTSRLNLALTLGAGVVAITVLSIIDISEWVKIPALVAVPIVLILEAWTILQKGRDAVVAFYLEPNEKDDALAAPDNVDASKLAAASPRLAIRVRTHAGEEKSGIVAKHSFVSFYFVSILYQLDSDAAWRRWFPHALALWPDSIDRARAREVRVMLKWR
jgi:hypothetical protein